MHNYVTSQTCLTLLLRHYEFTNEKVSYFLTNQSKTKTFIDLKVPRKPKPTKNSTRPYLNEIPAHFTHEIKTKVMTSSAIIYPPQDNEIPPQKKGVTDAPYTTDDKMCLITLKTTDQSWRLLLLPLGLIPRGKINLQQGLPETRT